MILYALRILVALLTFAVGVAAAWLLDFKSSPDPVKYEVKEMSVNILSDVPPPPRHSCPLEGRRIVVGGILNGKAISKPQPAYPPDAKAARVGGTVAVAIVVNMDGRVESAEAISGPELLRDAAVEAAREARFAPTLLSGVPVKVSGTITYNFLLQ